MRRRTTRFALVTAACFLGLSCHDCGDGSRRAPEADSAQPPLRVDADSGAGAPAHDPVATLRSLRGDVRWQPASAASWAPAREGQELRPSDAVQTMADGSAELYFPAIDSVARLGPDTTLRVPEQAPRASRFVHLRGRLVARLSPEAPGRMEVELPPGTLVLDREAVRESDAGPEAHVEITENRTAVTMLEGRGRLERRQGEAVTIDEQHFVEVAEGGEVLASGPSPPVVSLASPRDGATIRTRGRVGLEWSPPLGVEASVVEVTGPAGRVASARVATPGGRAEVELEVGQYQWNVHAESQGRAGVVIESRSFTVEIDRTPPRLEVASPRANASIGGGTVHVAGTTEPDATVDINGQPATVAADGAFAADLPVPRGLTNVVVRAADEVGNTRSVARTVLRE